MGVQIIHKNFVFLVSIYSKVEYKNTHTHTHTHTHTYIYTHTHIHTHTHTHKDTHISIQIGQKRVTVIN